MAGIEPVALPSKLAFFLLAGSSLDLHLLYILLDSLKRKTRKRIVPLNWIGVEEWHHCVRKHGG